MAATAKAWRTTALAQNQGDLWGNLAIPGAAARMVITSGTPDSVLNTGAFHYGATEKGSELMIAPSYEKFSVDEFRGPIVTNVGETAMGISASLVAVTDMDVITNMLSGVGTYATTASTFKEVRIGIKAITYQCAALIFPLIEDTAKYGVFQLYSCLNDAGVKWTQSRKTLGFLPINLVAFEVTTRAATDTLGIYWKEIA